MFCLCSPGLCFRQKLNEGILTHNANSKGFNTHQLGCIVQVTSYIFLDPLLRFRVKLFQPVIIIVSSLGPVCQSGNLTTNSNNGSCCSTKDATSTNPGVQSSLSFS